MSQAALLRRLRNAPNGVFPPSRYQQGEDLASPRRSVRDVIEAEQDYHRIQLAAELLKIAAEASQASALPGIADLALEAAAKIYPELPAEEFSAPAGVNSRDAPPPDHPAPVLGRQE